MQMSKLVSLESRRLLAGNVLVVASENFTVTINGDKKSNVIEVRLSEDRDGYLIRGLKSTRINGKRELVLRSPTAVFMNVNLGKGDDVVTFVGALNTQSVTIDTGDGKDRIRVTGVSHFGDLNISTGKGDDDVALTDVHVTQNLAVDLGRDKDKIAFSAVQVDGNASVNGGSGKNSLRGRDELSVGGQASINSLKSERPRDDDDDDDDDDRDDD